MNDQMFALMQRRNELLARIAVQRDQAAEIGSQLKTPLAFADKGLAVARFLRSKPVLVAGMVALFVIRRRGVIGLVQGAWRLWKNYRQLAAFSAKLSPRV
jgi:hypothetical protein